MSRRARTALFLASAAAFGLLLVWGLWGLPAFGHFQGPYDLLLGYTPVQERQATDVVVAVTFDYRGFDTLGEEFILFTAAVGLVVLLREQRGEREEEEQEEQPAGQRRPETSDALRVLGLVMFGPLLVLGLYIVTHGQLTPGGGFQGGVILAAALVFLYLTGRRLALRRVRSTSLVELAEAAGAAGFVLVGLGGLVAGSELLFNFLPLGTSGSLLSAGTILLLNVSVGLEVAGAFVLTLSEFLDQRLLRGRGGGA